MSDRDARRIAEHVSRLLDDAPEPGPAGRMLVVRAAMACPLVHREEQAEAVADGWEGLPGPRGEASFREAGRVLAAMLGAPPTGHGLRPPLDAARRAVVDAIERAVRGIRHPVDVAECFRVQCHLAIEAAGHHVVCEVPMSAHRRVDLVAVGPGGTYAIECDRFRARSQSLGKFRDMPEGVVRVLVLRRRSSHREVLPHVDRVVAVESSMRPLAWLTEGGPIPVEEAPDRVRRFLDGRAAEATVAWRRSLLTGGSALRTTEPSPSERWGRP